MIPLKRLRALDLSEPSRPGRPSHVSAASGLVRGRHRLYVVADDENHLGVFPARGKRPGTLARIARGKLPLPAGKRKRSKRDFESIARLPAFPGYPEGALLALGSCSKPNRCKGALVRLDAQGGIGATRTALDLSSLRGTLEERLGGVNIEGALVLGGALVLLQRGNKGPGRNASVHLDLDRVLRALARRRELGAEAILDIRDVDLGSIAGVPLGFSDGTALPGGRIAFTAIAEDTGDSYHDGACRGAALGVLGRDGGVELLKPLDPCYKVEGIEAWTDGGVLHALLVSDADDPDVPASLLRCAVSLRP
jgi:hypothetical protein